MTTANKELMAQAREALSDKWGLAVGTIFVYILIMSGLQAIPGLGTIGSFIIGGPMAVGLATFALSLARNEESRFEQIFEGFQDFSRHMIAYLMMILFVFIGFILLIIPGIIWGIGYSQTFFILSEDKEISANDALKKSTAMMEGNKWKYFFLQCRFIGWAILCVFTLGIGVLFLAPYVYVSNAKFYDDLKNNSDDFDFENFDINEEI